MLAVGLALALGKSDDSKFDHHTLFKKSFCGSEVGDRRVVDVVPRKPAAPTIWTSR